MPDEKTETMNTCVSLPLSLVRQLDRIVFEEKQLDRGYSRTALITYILQEWMERKGEEK